MIDLELLKQEIRKVSAVRTKGRIIEVTGMMCKAMLTGAAQGDLVRIQTRAKRMEVESLFGTIAVADSRGLLAQVVGFAGNIVFLSPFGSSRDVLPGAEVEVLGEPPKMLLGYRLLGTVVDALGRELYRARQQRDVSAVAPSQIGTLHREAPSALSRRPINQVFTTGIRALDAFVTLGCGQRLSIFAEPGVGKSTLLGMIAKNSMADINVFGLVGERGREVQELLVETLDAETLSRSVVVVSTSDEAPVCRIQAAYTAVRIAEYFRDQGSHVLLQVDSLTRLFRAFREVGLAAGEIPVRRGYPPSVFSALPGLIERAGTNEFGSITALYTVLLSSDLDEDPMVDEVKGLTDGHILLSRELAEQGHFPAIDILASISRLAARLGSEETKSAVRTLRAVYSRLKKDKELVLLGGRADEDLEKALLIEKSLISFLQQDWDERSTFEETEQRLLQLVSSLKSR